MSVPDDIPEDLNARALTVRESVGEVLFGRHERGFVSWPLVPRSDGDDRLLIDTIIARELLAEREAERARIIEFLVERCGRYRQKARECLAAGESAEANIYFEAATETLLLATSINQGKHRPATDRGQSVTEAELVAQAAVGDGIGHR